MKQKTHSGTKKRIKVNNKGKASVRAAAGRHLLINKSSSQKKRSTRDNPVNKSRLGSIKKLMAGKVKSA